MWGWGALGLCVCMSAYGLELLNDRYIYTHIYTHRFAAFHALWFNLMFILASFLVAESCNPMAITVTLPSDLVLATAAKGRLKRGSFSVTGWKLRVFETGWKGANRNTFVRRFVY